MTVAAAKAIDIR